MILVTGDMGVIGKHLTGALATSEGYDILNSKDIRDAYTLDLAFETSQCDTVIHLASRPGVRRSMFYPDEYISTNITGTWNVGKMCEKYGCRLICFSSSSVYGESKPPTKESDPKNPLSLYGITKLAAENIVNNLSIAISIIRLFPGFGENGR